MKHSTATLEGANLDYAVALALGYKARFMNSGDVEVQFDEKMHRGIGLKWFTFLPSTEWREGGPIIELGIPDDYEYRDPELMKMIVLRYKLARSP